MSAALMGADLMGAGLIRQTMKAPFVGFLGFVEQSGLRRFFKAL
jgi:hypothetical protein